MKKVFLLALLGLFLASGSFAMKDMPSNPGKGECPYQKQYHYQKRIMSPEEWEKYHKGMPMPEQMRKDYEATKKHGTYDKTKCPKMDECPQGEEDCPGVENCPHMKN